MSLFLDSASVQDARQAMALGPGMRAVVDACDTPTEILVASLKSLAEVVTGRGRGHASCDGDAGADARDGPSPAIRSSHRRICARCAPIAPRGVDEAAR